MRRFAPCLLSLLVAAPSLAQDPESQIEGMVLPRVKALLRSEQAKDVAWGAYLAGKYRLYQAGGGILRELSEWSEVEGEPTDEHLIVQMHLLDGLLGVGRKAPPVVLSRLLEHPVTRDAAFAVMAQDPVAYAMDLVRIAKQPAHNADLVRRAAGQLLIHKRRGVRDLMLYALEELQIELSVTVQDASSDNMWNSAVGLGGVPQPRMKTEDGFPPLVKLELTTNGSGERGDRVVVPAVKPLSAICLHRSERAVYRPYDFERFAPQERPSRSLAMLWLNAAAGTRARSYPSLWLQWKDAKSYEADCRASFDEHRAELDQVIARLVNNKHLRKSDRDDCKIPLKVTVHDARGDKSTALPELGFGQ